MFARPVYDPSTDTGVFRLSGTAVERPILVAPFLARVRAEAPDLSVEVIHPGSQFQTIQHLQQGTVDLAFMPLDAGERSDGIMRRRMLELRNVVYFDASYTLAQGDLDAFCKRPQVRVALGPDASFEIDRRLAKLGRKRQVAVQVPDFDSAVAFVRGTDLIVTLPNVLDAPGLVRIDPPWEASTVELGAFWHARSQTSARHSHWRHVIAKISRAAAMRAETV